MRLTYIFKKNNYSVLSTKVAKIMSNYVFSFLQSSSRSSVLSEVIIRQAVLFTESAVKRTNLAPSGDYIHLFDWQKRNSIILDSCCDSFIIKYRWLRTTLALYFLFVDDALTHLHCSRPGGRRFESQSYCLLSAKFVLYLV